MLYQLSYTPIEIGAGVWVAIGIAQHVSWGFGEFLVRTNARREPIVNWRQTLQSTTSPTRQPQGHLAHHVEVVKTSSQLL